jgi:exopolyphosphatase/guanosine-5'-triphosphate,3'-diphosphate pyrophosphatase
MLSALNLEGRAALPCIGEERADLVVPGCAILEAICDSWPVGQLRVADRGLREGMLLELMISDGLPVTGNPPARGSDKADHATSSATT